MWKGSFRDTDSHFPAREGFKRKDMCGAMGWSSVMPHKLGKLIFPVRVLSCCRSDMLIQSRHESFCFTICFGPQRSSLTVMKPKVTSLNVWNSFPLKGGPLSVSTTSGVPWLEQCMSRCGITFLAEEDADDSSGEVNYSNEKITKP